MIKACRLAPITFCYLIDPLGEDFPGAFWAVAEEFGHGQEETHGVTLPGQILECAPVAAVDAGGETAAGGTGSRLRCGGDVEDDDILFHSDVIQAKGVWFGQ